MRPALAIIELCMRESFALAAELVGAPSTNLQNPVPLVQQGTKYLVYDLKYISLNIAICKKSKTGTVPYTLCPLSSCCVGGVWSGRQSIGHRHDPSD